MTTTAIRPKDRDAVIQSLRAGVVPRTGQHLIQVGRVNEIAALIKDIERVADSGSCLRFVIGEYGSGKTFFLNLVRAIALEKRLYIQEDELNETFDLSDCLRTGLVQTIAMVRLLLAKWYEPPPSGGLHLSTMVQQMLSLIAQYGGVTAAQAFNVLCKNGPFPCITQQQFADFLRCLGDQRLIMQASDGLLLHGQVGERIVNHFSFYTAFMTPEEYRLISGDRTLGTLPIDRPVAENSLLIFGGRRWLVLEVDSAKKVIVLKPAKGGNAPIFGGQAGWVHDRVRQEMFAVYSEASVPVFLDVPSKELLAEARENFHRYGLAERHIVAQGTTTHIFCWMGDRAMDTLAAMLRSKGLKATNEGISVAVFSSSTDEVVDCLRGLHKEGPPDAYDLARSVKNKACEKYDLFLSDELLSADYAISKFDVKGALDSLNDFYRFTHWTQLPHHHGGQ
jgi:ATP-dependent Lhr-like helicase